MAELVELNLEQSLTFFNGLKNHIDESKFKELVRKRKHYEYKICSLNKNYESFIFFLEHELKVLDLLESLHITDGKTLINHHINFIERLVRQLTTHFKHEPKAFLFSTYVLKRVQRFSSECSCWEQLLNWHGSKNIKFYTCAAIRGMKSLETVQNRNIRRINSKLKTIEENLKSDIYLNSAAKLSKLEQEKSELLLEKHKSQYDSYIVHMKWTGKVLMSGLREFPNEKHLFELCLFFAIENQEFLTKYSDLSSESTEHLPDQNGDRVEYLLNLILRLFPDDSKFLEEIIDIVISKSSPFASSDIVEKMKEIVRNIPIDEEMPVPMEQSTELKTDEEIFKEFNARFPDLSLIRMKNPSEMSAEFHRYLEIVREKLLSNQIDKKNDYPIIKSAIERILIDDDWAPVALDLWWDYYQLEKCVSTPLKYMMILQRATQKLKFELKTKLQDRIWKEKKSQK